MRGHIKDARGDAGGVNGFDGFGKSRAGTGRRRKLRVRSNRQECGQKKQDCCAIANQKTSLCLVGAVKSRIPAASLSDALGKNVCYMTAPETGSPSAAGAKGHSLISRARIRNASAPS